MRENESRMKGDDVGGEKRENREEEKVVSTVRKVG